MCLKTTNVNKFISNLEAFHFNCMLLNLSALNKLDVVARVLTFLLFQQTAVQSAILFLIRTVDKILQTCSVVKNSASTAATIQTDMAVSDSDA